MGITIRRMTKAEAKNETKLSAMVRMKGIIVNAIVVDS